MRIRFVGLVKRVRAREFLLVMHEPSLLLRGEDAVLGYFVAAGLHIGLLIPRWPQTGQVVSVLQFGEGSLTSETPCQTMVMHYKAHMVCIDESERDKTVSHDGEESDEDVIDYVNDVVFPASNVDPAYCSQHILADYGLDSTNQSRTTPKQDRRP